jgi:hypothetical protein
VVRRGAREVGGVPPCAGATRKEEEPEALGAEGSAQVQPEVGPIVPEGRKMKTCYLSPEANDDDFRRSCEALGIDPEHPYAAQLLDAAVEEVGFMFAEAYAELYEPGEPFDA